MVSYEKIRQSLRNATFGLAIWYIVVMVLSGMTMGVGVVAYRVVSTQSVMQDFVQPLLFSLIIALVSFLLSSALVPLLFKNIKQLDAKQAPSPLAYYLGIAQTIIPPVISFFILGTPERDSLVFLEVSYGIPIIVLATHIYALKKLATYQHKDDYIF